MSRARALLAIAGAALCALLVGLYGIHLLAPQRAGPIALTQVLAPHLILALAPPLLLVRTAGRPGRLLRWSLAVAGVVFMARFVPGWIPVPAAAGAVGGALGVVSWNLELGEPAAATVVSTIAGTGATVVGLQELTPRHAEAIAADPDLARRYPTMVLRARDGSLGMGLLAAAPLVGEPTVLSDPPMIVARLDAGARRPLVVVVAHPMPARIATLGAVLPVGYDPTLRDLHLQRVRSVVEPMLAAGDPLLLIGDFNVVDREPGYLELVEGLVDAQAAVGLGPGPTWRPPRLDWLPLGLLRIDYLLAGNGVTPRSVSADCTPTGSDHCLLTGTMALPDATAPTGLVGHRSVPPRFR